MPNSGEWTRDEIGEYHDGDGNLITRDDDGWYLIRDRATDGPFRTLGEAKREASALRQIDSPEEAA